MVWMDNIGKIAIIFSFIGIFTLYGILLLVDPPLVSLDDVAHHKGAEIRTTGFIREFRITEAGNVVMAITGGKARTELPLFVRTGSGPGPGLLNLSYGDKIEVEGRVGTFRGDIQLVVSGDTIRRVSPKQESNITFISQIAVDPGRYDGRKIRVVGYIDDRFTRIFFLRSSEIGGHRMRVVFRDKDMSIAISELQEGARIIVVGFFSYEPMNLRYELNLISFEEAR